MVGSDEKAVFEGARAIIDPDERAAYVQHACGSDKGLARRIHALLAADREDGDILQLVDATTGPESFIEQVGDVIGRYRLLQKIGEGGFGVVYMAEQKEPVRRKVALKLIKPGMDTKLVIARFKAERQALALMDHPNIAKVFDGGATESGRPYFVMELVKGIPLTDYCDDNEVPTVERLKLFVQVCRAIEHARKKGIIHRDLKPSNIMVTLNDGEPIPKVIDFGIAKALDREMTESTLFTEYGLMLGTLQYMSPEQAGISAIDVDTRSDVYSLGVVLYELLTGETPLDPKRVRTLMREELRRAIREEEPPSPSERLSSLGDRLTSVAKHHGTTPKKIRQSVRDELDWIVEKALQKKRSLRYQSASALASDVLNHLEGRPIEARRPSLWYRASKLARRNKLATTFLAILAMVVLVGAVGFVAQAQQLANENDSLRSREQRFRRERFLNSLPVVLSAAIDGDVPRARELLDRDPATAREMDDVDYRYLRRRLRRSHSDFSLNVGGPLVVSPTGDYAAVSDVSKLGRVVLIDTKKRSTVRQFESLKQFECPLAFSPQGDVLAFIDSERKLSLLDLTSSDYTIKQLDVKIGGNHRTEMLFLNSHQLVVWSDNREIRVLECRTGKTVSRAKLDRWQFGDLLGVGPQERLILADGQGGGAVLNASSGERVGPVLGKPFGQVYSSAVSEDGALLALGFRGKGRVCVWSVPKYELVASFEAHQNHVFDLAFVGKNLVSSSRDGVRVWDSSTWAQAHQFPGDGTWISFGCIDKDGMRFLSAGLNRTEFWQLDDNHRVRELRRGKQIREVMFLDDETLLYYEIAGDKVWRVDVKTLAQRPFLAVEGTVWSIAKSIDGKVAIGQFNGEVIIKDVKTGQSTKHRLIEPALKMQFSPRGRYLAVAGGNGVGVWQVGGDGQLTERFRKAESSSGDAVAVDAQNIAFKTQDGTEDGKVELWNWRTNQRLQTFQPANTLTHIEFSHRGDKLLTASINGSVEYWNCGDGRLEHVWRKRGVWLWQASFSPTHQSVMATGNDRRVTLWDIATRERRFEFPELDHPGKTMAISPAQKWLAVGTMDGQLCIWDVRKSGKE